MKTNMLMLGRFTIFLLCFLPLLGLGQANIVTVTSSDDTDDGRCSTGHCSYREALNLINGFQGDVFIHFDIPGNGNERRIELTSSLPEITIFFASLTVDGTTQPNGAQIVIDGNNVADYGLNLLSASTAVVDGITFDNCRFAGVFIQEDSDDCVIGTTKGGNTFTNSQYGVINEGERTIVRNNQFIDNDISGLFVTSGASASVGEDGNRDADNSFIGHALYGVESVRGTDFTTVFGGSFFCNGRMGIESPPTGNGGVDPPTITDASTSFVTGKGSVRAQIQVYALNPNQSVCKDDNPCQGNIFLGSTTTATDGSWELSGNDFETPISDDFLITATQTIFGFDNQQNSGLIHTSEFADCFSLCTTYSVSLVLPNVNCAGDSFTIAPTFTANGPETEPLSFSWTGPNGFTANTAEISTNILGAYTFTASNSCNNIVRSVIVSAFETPPSTINTSTNAPICEFDALFLFADTIPGLDYNWTGPIGFTSTEQNPLVNGGANSIRSGDYILTTQTSLFGCEGPSDTVAVFIKDPPIGKDTTLTACADIFTSTAFGSFDLTVAEDHVSCGDSTLFVGWYRDQNLRIPISDPENYISVNDTVYAFLFDSLQCVSDPIPVALVLVAIPSIDLAVVAEPTCENPNGGRINSTILGGTPPFSFIWTPTGDTTFNIDSLSAGLYTLRITDANGCTASAEREIQAPETPVFRCEVLQDATIVGGNDGQAIITNSLQFDGPSIIYINGPILDTLNGGVNTRDTISNLVAGNYTFIVEDANGCQDSCQLEIQEPDCANFSTGFTKFDIDCPGQNTGLIRIAFGGAPPIQFDWNVDSLDGNSFADNLAAGLYTIIVSDAQGCSDTINTEIIELSNLQIDCQITQAVSGVGAADAIVELNLTGGVLPYFLTTQGPRTDSIFINGEGIVTRTNLPAGSYVFKVRDANGCLDSCALEISNIDCSNLQLDLVGSNLNCNGDNSGSILSQVSGATRPIRYSWSNGSTDSTLSNISAGTYSLSITDALGCTSTETITITQPQALVVDCAIVQDISRVGAADGQAMLNFSGGTLPYRIEISGIFDSTFQTNTASSLSLVDLPPGTLTVLITDANGCQDRCLLEFMDPDCANFSASLTKFDIECAGQNTGVIRIASGGASPIEFDWNVDSLDGNSFVDNLSPGIYTIIVTDAQGCADTLNTEIVELSNLDITCRLVQTISGVGAADAEVETDISGGVPPYLVYSQGPVDDSLVISVDGTVSWLEFPAGSYTFFVEDANGCRDSCSLEISSIDCSDFSMSLVGTDLLCNNDNSGSIAPQISGGDQPFQYNWSNGSTDSTISNLPAGTYSLSITDTKGCTVIDSIIISEPTAVNANCTFIQGISRIGASDGQVEIDLSGGTLPYRVEISGTLDSSFQTNSALSFVLDGLQAGRINVALTDANGCTTSCSSDVPDIDCTDLEVTGTITNVSCPSEQNGTIQVNVSGGQAPFTYDWDIDSLDGLSFVSNLAVGTYTVLVEDARGCVQREDFTIDITNTVPELTVSNSGGICEGDCFSFDLNLTGQAPFLIGYVITANGISQERTLNLGDNTGVLEVCADDFPDGTSSIEVTFTQISDNSCTSTLNISRRINYLAPSIQSIDTLLCEGSTVTIAGETFGESNPEGRIILAGQASNGCDSIIEVSVLFISAPTIIDNGTVCNLENNTFKLSFDILGLPPFSINGVAGELFGNTFVSESLPATGSYPISVIDGLGCGTDFVVDAPDCGLANNCNNQAGTLLDFPNALCATDSLFLQEDGSSVVDSGAILLYAIHDGNETILGNILASNQIGGFAYQPSLQLNTIYHTAILIGRDNGFGVLDQDDPCLSVFLGEEFQFLTAPQRPLFIQGQDTLCVGETLQLSTQIYPEGSTYNWLTPLGDTIQTDTNSISFPNVGPELQGSFSVWISNGTCRSETFTPHQFITIDFPILYAGDDQTLCGVDQGVLLADPISFGTGTWTTPGSAIIINPNSDSTIVRNLPPGINPFIWTVSANECESTDTVFLNFFANPVINPDNLALEPGLNRITFDPFENDFLNGVPLNDSTVTILNQPEVGMVQFLADEGVFEYSAELSDVEMIAFEYQVCAPDCVDACDSATVMIDLPDVILEVPNGIIQGRDNEGLIIGNLDAFPNNEIVITNRWGVVVFRQNNYSNNNPWKGTHDGADLPQGTYYMYMRIEGKSATVRKTIHVIVR
ncbi:MAG: gliding motility-associated C-terminal domain-containing protein [Bacteroidota bacterium]